MRSAMSARASWSRRVPIIPPGNWDWRTASLNSAGAPVGHPSSAAIAAKWSDTASRPLVSRLTSCPRRRMLSTLTSVEGIEGPLASDEAAVCRMPIPCSTPIR